MSRLRRNGAAEETERNDTDTGKEALGMIGEIEGIGMRLTGMTAAAGMGMTGETEGIGTRGSETMAVIGMSVHGTTGGIGSRMTGTIADKAGIPVSAAEDVPGMCSAHF